MGPLFCPLAAERSEGHNGPELSLEPERTPRTSHPEEVRLSQIS